MSPAEVDSYCREVGAILEFIDRLKELDLANHQPTEQVTGLTNVTRLDDLQQLPDNQGLLANAGTVVAFRCGALADVRLLLPLFEPYISRSELMNLPAFHFYVRITALKAQEPMSGRTILSTEVA